ncbi:hypothetical protein [uncultured Paludibaculum sp.]|uniref:hypothetical protein n=1 Tax=uncultured Paludibaculum sp. TaxID=1765020 RepID=UPI002AAB98AF|nr:hypothetical protein [uncultured Paludibaculum sp.]
MKAATYGTVRVRLAEKEAATIFISPAPNYSVKDKGVDYVVFMVDDPKPEGSSPDRHFLRKASDHLSVSDRDIARELAAAALSGTKVKIEIESTDRGVHARVVGAEIPGISGQL